MPLTHGRTVDDALFGRLSIETSEADGRVVVSGERVPTVVIQRRPGAELNKFVPIGSRDAAALTMTVDGAEAELAPGKGGATRRSYRVALTVAGTRYLFKPNSTATSQLVRDGVKTIELSLGEQEGDFLVQWLSDADHSQPADAAIGYALAVAFRTGAMGLFSMLLGGAASAAPG